MRDNNRSLKEAAKLLNTIINRDMDWLEIISYYSNKITLDKDSITRRTKRRIEEMLEILDKIKETETRRGTDK